jgi:hypothetical protein
VFGFKSRFEFNCLGVFKKIRNPFPFNPLAPYPNLARACFGPALVRSAVAPCTPRPGASLLLPLSSPSQLRKPQPSLSPRARSPVSSRPNRPFRPSAARPPSPVRAPSQTLTGGGHPSSASSRPPPHFATEPGPSPTRRPCHTTTGPHARPCARPYLRRRPAPPKTLNSAPAAETLSTSAAAVVVEPPPLTRAPVASRHQAVVSTPSPLGKRAAGAS